MVRRGDPIALGRDVPRVRDDTCGSDGDSHLEHLRYIGEFLQQLPLAKLVPGDFNNNGNVDAADYVTWRKSFGSTTLANDNGVTPGVVDLADYNYWRSRFGATTSTGSGAGSGLTDFAAIPEPLTWVLAVVACIASYCSRQR